MELPVRLCSLLLCGVISTEMPSRPVSTTFSTETRRHASEGQRPHTGPVSLVSVGHGGNPFFNSVPWAATVHGKGKTLREGLAGGTLWRPTGKVEKTQNGQTWGPSLAPPWPSA